MSVFFRLRVSSDARKKIVTSSWLLFSVLGERTKQRTELLNNTRDQVFFLALEENKSSIEVSEKLGAHTTAVASTVGFMAR